MASNARRRINVGFVIAKISLAGIVIFRKILLLQFSLFIACLRRAKPGYKQYAKRLCKQILA